MRLRNQKKYVRLYRMVVVILGLSVLGSPIGAILLAIKDRNPLELLVAIGSAAIDGLARLLAPSPLNR